jgi:uncharacterized protein (TIGR02145 family)
MKHAGIIILFMLCYFSLSAQDYDVFVDSRDGSVYKTVKIGEQVWMAENLNYKSAGPGVIYPNDSPLTEVFGRLYCWEAAQEVCPPGWHLPSEEEFEILANSLGGEAVAGDKMKMESSYWSSSIEEANNESGFSALPGGYLENPKDESYPFMGDMGFFWSTTELKKNTSKFHYLKIDGSQFKAGSGSRESGMSVRCLKD